MEAKTLPKSGRGVLGEPWTEQIEKKPSTLGNRNSVLDKMVDIF